MALNKHTGEILWRYQSGTGEQTRTVSAGPTVWGRLLLANDFRGQAIFAVDRFTGQEVWRVIGAPGLVGPFGAPEVVEGTAYTDSNDEYVYAFKPQTGRVLWKTRTPASNRASAVCRNRIFANYLGMSVVDRDTGKILARKFESEEEFLTSGFAVHDDRVFAAGNKAVYAFRCE